MAPLAAGAPGKQRPPGGYRPDFSAAPSKIAFPSPRGGRKRPCCLLQGRAPTQKNGRGPPPWGGARPGAGSTATSNLGHNCANPKPPGWQQRGTPVWFGGHGPSCARLRAFAGRQAARGALWHRLGKFGAPRATAAPHQGPKPPKNKPQAPGVAANSLG